MKLKNAVIVASAADLTGALTVGAFSSKVTDTVMNIADFGNDKKIAIVGLCAAMCSVVIWAVAAWRFGIPTSESHALIAGLIGASDAVNGGFSQIDETEFNKIIKGMFVSVVVGFFAGFVLSKITTFFIEKSKSSRTTSPLAIPAVSLKL
jgi:PiT family inorganic phosphate transporter